jgi:hypothetical protein
MSPRCTPLRREASSNEGDAQDLITVALTATIDAPGERVWRALVDPAERPLWDDRILGEIRSTRVDASRRRPARSNDPTRRPTSRIEPIRSTRWRFRWSGIPLVLLEETLRAEGHDRIFGRISIGSMHFDQTLTIAEELDGSGPHARLGMKLVANNSIAVIGELVSRLEVQRLVIEYVDTTLRLVRKHCEVDR